MAKTSIMKQLKYIFATILLIMAYSMEAKEIEVLPQNDGTAITTTDSVYTEVSNHTQINVEKKKSIYRNLFVEFLASNYCYIGVGYDSRFKAGSKFGYHVGLAYSKGKYINPIFGQYLEYEGMNIPVEVNGIFGKWKSKFEIGIGVVPSILHRYQEIRHGYWDGYPFCDVNGDPLYVPEATVKSGVCLNAISFLNLGYRYQREKGFFMRVDFTLYGGNLKWSPTESIYPALYLAFGYTLP